MIFCPVWTFAGYTGSKNQVHQTWIFKLFSPKIKCRSIRGLAHLFRRPCHAHNRLPYRFFPHPAQRCSAWNLFYMAQMQWASINSRFRLTDSLTGFQSFQKWVEITSEGAALISDFFNANVLTMYHVLLVVFFRLMIKILFIGCGNISSKNISTHRFCRKKSDQNLTYKIQK